jgi:hypothetical protein
MLDFVLVFVLFYLLLKDFVQTTARTETIFIQSANRYFTGHRGFPLFLHSCLPGSPFQFAQTFFRARTPWPLKKTLSFLHFLVFFLILPNLFPFSSEGSYCCFSSFCVLLEQSLRRIPVLLDHPFSERACLWHVRFNLGEVRGRRRGERGGEKGEGRGERRRERGEGRGKREEGRGRRKRELTLKSDQKIVCREESRKSKNLRAMT